MRKPIATLLALGLVALLFVATRGGQARADDVDVAFYRVRLTYSTTSDHSSLQLLDPSPVLSMRPVGTSGDVMWTQQDVSRLALNQSYEQAAAGAAVSMEVDYALAPGARQHGLAFHLDQGSLNRATLEVSVERAGRDIVLGDIVAESELGNVGDLTVDLSGLTDEDLQHRSLSSEAPPKQLWALFYGWYGMDSWDSPTLLDGPLERYGSNDPQQVARQVASARSAGIDSLLASWWGPGHYTDETFPILLDAAAQQGMHAAIFLEPLPSGDQPIGEDELYTWLQYALTTYADHPAYARLDGRPVVGVWAADRVPDDEWQRVLARLRAAGLDPAVVGGGADLGRLELFDAGYDYLPRDLPLEPRSDSLQANAVTYYPLLADEPRRKVSIMTLNPGYDDHLVPGRTGTLIDREGGARYQATMDAALEANPDWVLITSWNEWYENTQIEPSELYGNQYVDLTAAFNAQWKQLPGRAPLPSDGELEGASATTGTAPPSTPPSTAAETTAAPEATDPPTTTSPATAETTTSSSTTTSTPTTTTNPTTTTVSPGGPWLPGIGRGRWPCRTSRSNGWRASACPASTVLLSR